MLTYILAWYGPIMRNFETFYDKILFRRKLILDAGTKNDIFTFK